MSPTHARAAAALAAALTWGCGVAGGGSGRPSLSTALPEAPGDHCPAGGQRIVTGVDVNGNGVLEAGEIQRVAYVCNRQAPATCTTLEGSVVVRNPFDWANLIQAGCTRITGTLEITAPGVTSLGAASPLVQVGRLEVWGSPALTSLRFPALATVDEGVILTGFPALTELQLPALARVGTSGLQVSEAPLLTAVDLPALTAVEGTLGLYELRRVARVGLPALRTTGDSITIGATACTSLRLPALEATGGLYVGGNPVLAVLELPALASSGPLIVADDPALGRVAAPLLATSRSVVLDGLQALEALDLPALTEVSEDLAFLALPALTQVGLPSLASIDGSLFVSGAARLERLEVPQLTRVASGFSMVETPRFPRCRAEAILARLQPPLPALVTLTGTDPTATCP